MAKRAVRYAVIDAFTSVPFKENPAAVCLLDTPEDAAAGEEWMQSVAKEFNISETAFLSRAIDVGSDSPANGACGPRFHLRWFTPVAEVQVPNVFGFLFGITQIILYLIYIHHNKDESRGKLGSLQELPEKLRAAHRVRQEIVLRWQKCS